MNDDVLIRVARVSKRFSRELRLSLRHVCEDIALHLGARVGRRELRSQEFWALQDVSFEVRRGESIAVIGDNGAGKSTLIKILMGRVLPTSGHVEKRGTINALTVLGLGFDPVLSGRENVLLNAATMGLSRKQTLELMDQILEFAELQEFADAPVQGYSSGMRARLGYAVAAHVNPDILLLDEVLAVGDIGFRRKCRRHIKNYIATGGTTLLVTHDMHAVQTMCHRAIVLDHGKIIFDGPTTEAIHAYLDNRIDREEFAEQGIALPATENDQSPAAIIEPEANEVSSPNHLPDAIAVAEPEPVDTSSASPAVSEAPKSPPPESKSPRVIPKLSPETPLVIREFNVHPVRGDELRTGEPADFRIRYEAIDTIPEIIWGFTVSTLDGLVHIASMIQGVSGELYQASPGLHELIVRVPKLPLHAGRYALKGGIAERETGAPINHIGWEDAPVIFSVRSSPSPENNFHNAIGDLVKFECSVLTANNT